MVANILKLFQVSCSFAKVNMNVFLKWLLATDEKMCKFIGKGCKFATWHFFSFTCANKIALLQIEAFNLLSVRIHIIERNIFLKEKNGQSFRKLQSRMDAFPII